MTRQKKDRPRVENLYDHISDCHKIEMGRKKRKPCPNNYTEGVIPKKLFSFIATGEDLARLDDAIHNHGDPFRREFYERMRLAESAVLENRHWSDNTINESRLRTTTLRHCWIELNWRPSKTCRYVYVKPPIFNSYSE